MTKFNSFVGRLSARQARLSSLSATILVSVEFSGRLCLANAAKTRLLRFCLHVVRLTGSAAEASPATRMPGSGVVDAPISIVEMPVSNHSASKAVVAAT